MAPCYPRGAPSRAARPTLRAARSQNMSPPTPLAYLRADKIGKLVAVDGSVIRASPLRPFITGMPFNCPRCRDTAAGPTCVLPLLDGKFEQPSGCPASGCRAKVRLGGISAAPRCGISAGL